MKINKTLSSAKKTFVREFLAQNPASKTAVVQAAVAGKFQQKINPSTIISIRKEFGFSAT